MPFPLRIASTISSMFSMRAWFGPLSQIASMAGSATISVIDAYALQAPTSSSRASAATLSALSRRGLHTPSTSASRTARNAWT